MLSPFTSCTVSGDGFRGLERSPSGSSGAADTGQRTGLAVLLPASPLLFLQPPSLGPTEPGPYPTGLNVVSPVMHTRLSPSCSLSLALSSTGPQTSWDRGSFSSAGLSSSFNSCSGFPEPSCSSLTGLHPGSSCSFGGGRLTRVSWWLVSSLSPGLNGALSPPRLRAPLPAARFFLLFPLPVLRGVPGSPSAPWPGPAPTSPGLRGQDSEASPSASAGGSATSRAAASGRASTSAPGGDPGEAPVLLPSPGGRAPSWSRGPSPFWCIHARCLRCRPFPPAALRVGTVRVRERPGEPSASIGLPLTGSVTSSSSTYSPSGPSAGALCPSPGLRVPKASSGSGGLGSPGGPEGSSGGSVLGRCPTMRPPLCTNRGQMSSAQGSR